MSADGDEVREALARAMAAQHSCDTLLSTSGRPCNRCRQSADAVLPVVVAHARRVAADELRKAADWLTADPEDGGADFLSPNGAHVDMRTMDWISDHLHDRAAALAAADNSEEGR